MASDDDNPLHRTSSYSYRIFTLPVSETVVQTWRKEIRCLNKKMNDANFGNRINMSKCERLNGRRATRCDRLFFSTLRKHTVNFSSAKFVRLIPVFAHIYSWNKRQTYRWKMSGALINISKMFLFHLILLHGEVIIFPT